MQNLAARARSDLQRSSNVQLVPILTVWQQDLVTQVLCVRIQNQLTDSIRMRDKGT